MPGRNMVLVDQRNGERAPCRGADDDNGMSWPRSETNKRWQIRAGEYSRLERVRGLMPSGAGGGIVAIP